MLAAGEALFTLVAPETVWILAYVDEARAGDIEVGQAAEVRLRSLPQQMFHGRVARIGIESDRVNEERRIYVVCDDLPEGLLPRRAGGGVHHHREARARADGAGER